MWIAGGKSVLPLAKEIQPKACNVGLNPDSPDSKVWFLLHGEILNIKKCIFSQRKRVTGILSPTVMHTYN